MIPFLPVAWPFHHREAKPRYAMNTATRTAYIGSIGSYALGEMMPMKDEQPEEEHPWWNIVLAE